MAKSKISRQARHQQRRKERGDICVNVWLPAEMVPALEALTEKFGSRAAAVSHFVEQGLERQQELAA